MSSVSRYHLAKQNNGRGWLVLRLDAIGSMSGTVVDCNLTQEDAHALLCELRAEEAGGDPEAIGKRGLATVAAALAKRKERAS